MAIQFPDPTESNALASLLALIEREVDKRVRPLEEMLQNNAGRKQRSNTEEYLDIDQLAERIHTRPKTIRDWVYKREANNVPVIKLPTGGLLFPWSEFEMWMRGEKS